MSAVFLTELGIKGNTHTLFIQHAVRSVPFSMQIKSSFRKQDETEENAGRRWNDERLQPLPKRREMKT